MPWLKLSSQVKLKDLWSTCFTDTVSGFFYWSRLKDPIRRDAFPESKSSKINQNPPPPKKNKQKKKKKKQKNGGKKKFSDFSKCPKTPSKKWECSWCNHLIMFKMFLKIQLFEMTLESKLKKVMYNAWWIISHEKY